ncbi:hypothetical protein GJ496_002343 [Pomphorhynchus laevis]|nr:hypothetical protein GJ496_002343 [Pomphorhynchus laevis]
MQVSFCCAHTFTCVVVNINELTTNYIDMKTFVNAIPHGSWQPIYGQPEFVNPENLVFDEERRFLIEQVQNHCKWNHLFGSTPDFKVDISGFDLSNKVDCRVCTVKKGCIKIDSDKESMPFEKWIQRFSR